MNKNTLRSTAKNASQLVYFGAGLYMIFAILSYFNQWELPLWQWIGAIVVFPVTLVVVPIYVGFTESDWSLIAVWIGALAVVGLSALIPD